MVKIKKIAIRASGIALAFAVVASPLAATAATDSDETTITATVGSTISVTSGPTVSIGLTPSGSAVVSSASDSVSVSTNNASGYTLTLANTDAVTDLVSGSDTIAAHAGTQASPSALADNRWGYAVPTIGGFDGSYTAETNETASTSTWAGVPATGAAETIRTHNSTATNQVTTVWYGVKVDATQPTGAYSDTVTYTATTI